MPKRLLFVVNVPWFFVSHRLPLAVASQKKGYEVHVASSLDDRISEITSAGLIFHKIYLSRSSLNPISECLCLVSLFRTFKEVKPDLVHLVTLKPVLYGGLIARFTKVPGVVAAVSGMGSVFGENNKQLGFLRLLVKKIYRIALRHKNCSVIFQNPEDQAILSSIGAVTYEQTRLIRGSGVDLKKYRVVPEVEGTTVVSMAARLLKEKGTVEFVDAARLLKNRGINCEFRLFGDKDYDNPFSITDAEIDCWKKEGAVRLMGFCDDIERQYAQSHIVCLPSYYKEGLPKCLVEAAACGRAVVTTDEPGCRDAIEPGLTGLLVPSRNSQALANAIQYLIENPDKRRAMGIAGRNLAEREFDINKIINSHLKIYQELEASNA